MRRSRKPLKNNDSAPVREALSSPTQYGFFCLADISEPRALPIGQRSGNRIGSGSLREPRRTGADDSRRFQPAALQLPKAPFPVRFVVCNGWPSDTDRSSYKTHEHSSRLGGQPLHTHHMPEDNYILGTLASGEPVPILQADRRRHLFLCGMTGTGKTGLFLNLMRADLESGAGFCFLDPHGDASLAVAAATPAERVNHVIYLDPSDPTHTFAYNPLAGVAEFDRATRAANIVSAFKNIWSDSWGPRLEYVLTNTLRLLLDNKDQTLIAIPRVFADDEFRKRLTKNCVDPVVRFYWKHEFEALEPRLRAETLSPIQNKIGVLLANPLIRSILCQSASTIDLADVMNEGKVLIVNLSKGGLGEAPAHLLGALLVTGISQVAEARRNIPEDARRDFTLYVDEFQNFATDSFASILSEARKWRLALVAANQHVAQLSEGLQQAVLGNAGTIIAFRLGASSAEILAAEFGLDDPRALRETSNFHAWVRLMRYGTPLQPHFVAMSPLPIETPSRLRRVVARSRSRYMLPRSIVEAQITAFLADASPRKPKNKKKFRRADG